MCLFLRGLNLIYVKFCAVNHRIRVLEKLEMHQMLQVGIS